MITAHSIAMTILHYCEEHSISQAKLAKKVGVSQQTLNCWARETKNPSMKNVKRLQEVMGKLEEE